MTDSKKSSDEESIIDEIAPSIEEINKIDVDESNDENKQATKEKSEEQDFDEEFALNSKINEFLTEDFRKKFPILPIIGVVLGVIFVIYGISLMLSASERVIDNVVSGETGTSSIFMIFLGVLIFGASFLKIIPNKNPISNTFTGLNDLTLLDEADHDNEVIHYNKNNLNEDYKFNNNDKDFDEEIEVFHGDSEDLESFGDSDELVLFSGDSEDLGSFDGSDELVLFSGDSEDLGSFGDSEELEISKEFDGLGETWEIRKLEKLEELEKIGITNSAFSEKISEDDFDNTTDDIDTDPN